MKKSIVKNFSISFSHRLLPTEGVFRVDNSLFADLVSDYRAGQRVKLLFVLDAGVADAHPGLASDIEAYAAAHHEILECTEIIEVPGGETAKNSERHTREVLQAIDRNAICRHSIVVAIGGGAVIDMVGYAASIAHRGVQLIRIPTTVLAQNDAAVGVKNGLNAFGKKNFVGTFAVPLAVINDREFLHTLQDRDWVAGMAEAVKVALIKDAEFFDQLEKDAAALRNRDMEAMDRLIFRCAELHMAHIAEGGDPFEGGSSRPLDFGHWSAHKLEHLTDYALRHGEAVAIGMALDVLYSSRIGWLPKPDKDRILQLLKDLGFRLVLPRLEGEGAAKLLEGIDEFREHLGGKLTITLLRGIGSKEDVHQVDREQIRACIRELQPERIENRTA